MADIGFTMRTRATGFSALNAKLSGLEANLHRAMEDGTEEGVGMIRASTVRMVVNRTTMDAAIAEAITESSMRTVGRGRWQGRVGFSNPEPGWDIRPRTKQALAFNWKGRNVVFASVHHPGSRPYKLIGRATSDVTSRIEAAYARRVGEVMR